jgi:hypothetical protein
MAISTYAELQTAAGNWLNRSDLTARIPEFIALAEARFRRKLDDPDQETTATITFTDGVAPLPADFGSLREIDGDDLGEDVIAYDIVGDEIHTNPAVTGTADITYKASLPALSVSNTTNWLLTRAPDAYLFGTLIQAEFYGWNDERLPLMKSALDEILEELRLDGEARRWGPNIQPQLGRT